MEREILSPVNEYKSLFKHKHKETVESYFDELASTSGVDFDTNYKTVKDYNHETTLYNNASKTYRRLKGLRVFLIVMIVLFFLASIICFYMFFSGENKMIALIIAAPCLLVAGIGFILLITLSLNKKIKHNKELADKHQAKANEHLQEAWRQVTPLSNLMNDNIATMLVEKTMGVVSFDPYLSSKKIDLLNKKYGLTDRFDDDTSVLALVTGELYHSPFVLFKTLNHEMGQKTYYGSLTITWTETTRDSNGNLRTVTRSQTLTASVNKPYPMYSESTSFALGSEVCPDLSFSRRPANVDDLSEKQLERKINKESKKLQKKTEQSTGNSGFTAMANSEFEVLFNALNRTNDVQFRMMFTPLAQTEMLKILKDNTEAWGDDFFYEKFKMLNIITPMHLKGFDITGDYRNYLNYDLSVLRKKFCEYNEAYFKHFYFTIAPTLAIPLLQQHKPTEYIYKDVYNYNLSYWQHEAVANQFSRESLAHPSSITNNIIKTKLIASNEDSDTIETIAYGYTGVDRVDYVTMRGNDGRTHSVPVPWVEYIPVEAHEQIVVKVDNKQTYKNEFFGTIRDRIYSYLNEKQIKTIESHFGPTLFAFLAGNQSNDVYNVKMKDILQKKNE